MSFGQDYHPPQGTKYKWSTKALNYSPWVCPFFDRWPARIVARVSLHGTSNYVWDVETTGFSFERTVYTGCNSTALQACLNAESFCEKEKARIWLPWMEEAVAADWRPPAQKG